MCFVLMPRTRCEEKHEQLINVKLLIKLKKKKLRWSVMSGGKMPMASIPYLVGVFSNGIKGFLKEFRR